MSASGQTVTANVAQTGVKEIVAEVWAEGGKLLGSLALDGGICTRLDSSSIVEGQRLKLILKLAARNEDVVNIWISIDDKTFDVHEVELSTIMTVRKSAKKALFTNSQNIVRLVRLDKRGGCTMINYAVVSQNGQFFLTQQVMFSAQAYRDLNFVRIPELQIVPKWVKLGAYLERELQDICDELPPLCNYVPYTDAANYGLVRSYSCHLQVGYVVTEAGTSRIHWSNIPEREHGFRYAKEGETLKGYRVVPREQNPAHTYTLDFKTEVKDVVVD